MRIEELIPGLSITLNVTINGEHLSFDSTISEVYPLKHLVLADAIYRNGKIVTFRGEHITIDLIVSMGNNKPELFKNVNITLIKKPDGSLCYNLSTTKESITYNRRQNFRCYVGIPTTLQPGPHRAKHVVTIRDISVTGFSVVCEQKLPLAERQMIHVVLKDYIEDTNEKFVFHLDGIIARIHPLENGNILYGCRLNHYLPGFEAYIMKKERLRLRRTNGGNL